MTCRRCVFNIVKDFDGELAIHFPGVEGLDKQHVLVNSKLKACLNCGYVEFVLPDEQLEQLKNDTAQRPKGGVSGNDH